MQAACALINRPLPHQVVSMWPSLPKMQTTRRLLLNLACAYSTALLLLLLLILRLAGDVAGYSLPE